MSVGVDMWSPRAFSMRLWTPVKFPLVSSGWLRIPSVFLPSATCAPWPCSRVNLRCRRWCDVSQHFSDLLYSWRLHIDDWNNAHLEFWDSAAKGSSAWKAALFTELPHGLLEKAHNGIPRGPGNLQHVRVPIGPCVDDIARYLQ
eukprot:1538559-Pyramimonas_sp.AAC.1